MPVDLRRVPMLVLALLCLLQIGARPASAQSTPMTFQAVRIGNASVCRDGCPFVIAAMGQITEETPSQFMAFLDQNGSQDLHAVVLIDSPGGRVLASMEFGTMLRKIGATAVVAAISEADGLGMTAGQCFSACVYALMGARKRIVPNGSLVGIHRMFVNEQGMSADGEILNQKRFDNGEMRGFLMRYSSSMGVSPSLIAAAERVSSDELRILTPSEIRRWHLGTSRP